MNILMTTPTTPTITMTTATSTNLQMPKVFKIIISSIWEVGSLFGPASIIKTRRSPVGCRRHLASSIIVVSVLIVQQPFYDYVHVCKHFVQPGWSPQPSCWRPTGASAMASGRCFAWTWFLCWKNPYSNNRHLNTKRKYQYQQKLKKYFTFQ